MTNSLITAATAGLCPVPRDFLRHGNIPKKSIKEKAEAKYSDFFGLLLEYSLNSCVPALPFSASSSNVKYTCLLQKKIEKNKRGLPSVTTWSKLATNINELEAQNKQEANHE